MIAFWAAGSAAGRHMPPMRMCIYVFGIVLAGGVLWEGFEYVTDITDKGEGYALDMLSDLLNDCIGALLPMGMYWWLYNKKELYV